MKKVLLFALLAFASQCAFGQSVALYHDSVINSRGVPVPGARVHVCTATSSPCSAPTIYSNLALTVVSSSTVTADANGNFSFYAACANYDLQISGTGILPYTIHNVPVVGPSCVLSSIAVGTTTTLPSGSSATVGNSGDSSHAVLNFGVPRGPIGASGYCSGTPAAWNSGTSYTTAQCAISDNQLWFALQSGTNHTPTPGSAYWVVLSSPSSEGYVSTNPYLLGAASIVEATQAAVSAAASNSVRRVVVGSASYSPSAIATWPVDAQGFETAGHTVGITVGSNVDLDFNYSVLTYSRTNCSQNGSLVSNAHRTSFVDHDITIRNVIVVMDDLTTGCANQQLAPFLFAQVTNLNFSNVWVTSNTISPNKFFLLIDIKGGSFRDNKCDLFMPYSGDYYGNSCFTLAQNDVDTSTFPNFYMSRNTYKVVNNSTIGFSVINLTQSNVVADDETFDGCTGRPNPPFVGNSYEIGGNGTGGYAINVTITRPKLCGLNLYPVWLKNGQVTNPTISNPFSPVGHVNTSGTAVTLVDGNPFNTLWTAGGPMVINGTSYQISSCASTTACTLATSAGTQSGVTYTVAMPRGNIKVTAAGGNIPNSGSIDIIGGTLFNADATLDGVTGDTGWRNGSIKGMTVKWGGIAANNGSECLLSGNTIINSPDAGMLNLSGCRESGNTVINASVSNPLNQPGIYVSRQTPLVDNETIDDHQTQYLTGSNGSVCNVAELSAYTPNNRTCSATPTRWVMLEDLTKYWQQNYTNACLYIGANCHRIHAFSAVSGKVNTHGTVNVDRASGDPFDTSWPANTHIMIAGEEKVISSVTDADNLVLTSASGYNTTNLAFNVSAPGTSMKTRLLELEDAALIPTGTNYDLKTTHVQPLQVAVGIDVLTNNRAFGTHRNLLCDGGSGQTFGYWHNNYFNGQQNCSPVTPSRFDVRFDEVGTLGGNFGYGFQIGRVAGGIPCPDSGTPSAANFIDCTVNNTANEVKMTLAPGSITVGGNGLNATIVVKGSDGNDCNVVLSHGIVASTTCP